MKLYDQVVVQTALPRTGSWWLGSAPYGVEPLSLPFPGAPLDVLTCQPAAMDDIAASYAGMAALLEVDDEEMYSAAAEAPDPTELYWFRWITGHQLSFIAWRLAADIQTGIDTGALDRAAGAVMLASCVDCYSALLVYSGSCPGDTYHEVIRPSMHLHHPAFSGSWAPDYQPVRRLFHGRTDVTDETTYGATLRLATERNERIHEFVAARLVPDGVSLLRSSDPATRRQDMRMLNLLYDSYFITVRTALSPVQLVAQLLRRVHDVIHDVALNGCDADGGAAPTAHSAEAGRTAAELPHTLLRLAETACFAVLHPEHVRAGSATADPARRQAS